MTRAYRTRGQDSKYKREGATGWEVRFVGEPGGHDSVVGLKVAERDVYVT